MKKAIIVVAALLVIAGIAASLYFGLERTETGELLIFGMTPDALSEYVKSRIVPLCSGVMTAVAAIYVAVSPALNKIKTASGRFEQATRDVNSAAGDVKENKRYVEKVERELKEDMDEIKKEYGAIDERLDEIERAVLIAFTNQKELVANGSANRIERLISDSKRARENDEAEQT